MPSVQIKNVPEDVHAVLRRRAAAAGQSLQSYLLARLVDEAETGSNRELFERIEKRRDWFEVVGTASNPLSAPTSWSHSAAFRAE